MRKLIKKKQCAKQKGNMRQLAEVTNELGDKYFLSGDLSKALEEYTEAVKAYEIFGVNLKCAIAYRRLGEISMDLGRYECAIKHLNLHLEEVQKMQNAVEEQRGSAALGRTYYLLAHTLPVRSDKQAEALANARKAYNRSILLCNNELKGVPKEELMMMRARLLLNQGLVQYFQMEPNEGISLIKSAIKLFSVNNLSDELHRAYLALGDLYGKQGNITLAVQMLDRAVETENKSTKGDATLAKAQLFLKNGKWRNAREVLVALYPDKSLSQSLHQQLDKFLRIAVTLCRGKKKLRAGNMEINRLKLYEELGDAAAAACCYDKALEYYQEMLHYAENDGSTEKIAAASISLAQTFKDAGRYKEALPFAMRELKMCSDSREACKTALLLADLLESAGSDSFRIIDMFKLALLKAEISGDPSLEVTVLEEHLHYLENRKSKIKTRLDLLPDRTPDLASQREVPQSQLVGADICLDELLDMEPSDEEHNKDEPGTSMCNNNMRYSIRKNHKGETLLHSACIKGNDERVRKLLEDGHPTNARDNCGWTPLHEAANHGFLNIVRLLINAGANVNDPGGSECGGVTPLHDAASCGHIFIMNLLIENGADIHAITKEGDSILDSLEDWRNRVKNLSSMAEFEYESIHNKLDAEGVRGRKKKRMDMGVASGNKKNIELIQLDED